MSAAKKPVPGKAYTPGRGQRASPALLPRHRFAKYRLFVNAGARHIWKSSAKDKASAVIVWFLLWQHEDKQSGLVEVGIDRLAKELGSDKRTVQRGLAVLKQLLFIKLEVAGVWGGGKRGGKANVYRLYARPYDLEAAAEGKAVKLDPRYARPHNLPNKGDVSDEFCRAVRLALEDHGYRLPAKVFTLIRESWGGEYAADKEYAEIMVGDCAYESDDGYLLPVTRYTVGQVVYHEDCGKGQVVEVSGWWEGERVTVRFLGGGVEVLDASDKDLQDDEERQNAFRVAKTKAATPSSQTPPAAAVAKPAPSPLPSPAPEPASASGERSGAPATLPNPAGTSAIAALIGTAEIRSGQQEAGADHP